ncbi:MAG: methylated-DNA--[protein]-cysteine S-methyltransferase, partial [Patescibacteria group bacterium]
MKNQKKKDFERMALAIDYLQLHFKEQPSLEDVARRLHLSPTHFQRMFKTWVGVSPKKFLQYVSVEYAKKLLEEEQSSLWRAAHKTGLSGSARLHDLFVNIEGMTPGEYKNGGEKLAINYSFSESPFGDILIASTSKGIAHMAFVVTGEKQTLEVLQKKFPKATFTYKLDAIQKRALSIFTHDRGKLDQIKLHLKGTDFQLKVWQMLLSIPAGQLATYGSVAKGIGQPKASRAVGTAIGSNPVAFLIPCHRVIQATGVLGDYHWGSSRKKMMIG